MTHTDDKPFLDPDVENRVIALIGFTNDRFLPEWRWLLIDRIKKSGRSYYARIPDGQGVPNVTPGETETWGLMLKGDNAHLRLPTLSDGESVEMTFEHLKSSPTQTGSD